MSDEQHDTPHTPAPSLWPIGFAIGVACILVGLVVSVPALIVGALIALVFGFLWIRDLFATRPVDSATAGAPSDDPAQFGAVTEADLGTSVDRATFLSIATIGVGGLIGAGVTLPVLGFGVLPSFMGEGVETFEVDLGPISNFPEGKYVIATFLESPEQGEVSRRTAFIRNNGRTEDGVPSFTTLFSRCVHLGCPVQPNGPIDEEATAGGQRRRASPGPRGELRLPLPRRPLRLRGEPERRPAGPLARPVRVLDQGRQPRARPDLQRRHRRGHGRQGADLEVLPGLSRACTSTGSSDSSTRSRPRGARARAWRSSPPSRRQLETAALYPLDWVEERSGLVGYTKWFLFRKVPRDISWAQTLGAAALTAFIVQTLTGVFLAMYYQPDPNTPTARWSTSPRR